MEEKTMRDMIHLTFGEEVGNAISHGVMALACLFVLPFAAVYSYLVGGVVRAVGVSIFIICLFLMFLISTIYHSMDYNTEQKYVFRKLDHIGHCWKLYSYCIMRCARVARCSYSCVGVGGSFRRYTFEINFKESLSCSLYNNLSCYGMDSCVFYSCPFAGCIFLVSLIYCYGRSYVFSWCILLFKT